MSAIYNPAPINTRSVVRTTEQIAVILDYAFINTDDHFDADWLLQLRGRLRANRNGFT